jgi:uncharacterized protein (TIGR02246 family)
MNIEAAVRELLDREHIRDTLYRYASTIDVKDWQGLRNLFASDAAITMVGGAKTQGADAIVEYIRHRCRKRGWQHHLLSVYHIELKGDEASALTYHTSHQKTDGKPEHILQLVARYRDRLRRIDGAWKIVEKEMELGWFEERLRVSGGDLMDK